MKEKSKTYFNTKFNPEVISEALESLKRVAKSSTENFSYLTVTMGDVTWKHTEDSEFFSDYRNPKTTWASYRKTVSGYMLDFTFSGRNTYLKVAAEDRGDIEIIFEIFEKNLSKSKLESPPKKIVKPIIFIGHGRSGQWRELKDHLQDKHSYSIEAYEVGARAGHTIRDIIDSMLEKSTFAILVMTGEDIDAEGNIHARDNVIHELGLFQGKLGSQRAIVLLEDETVEFSNIHGIQQIRYSNNNIKETFGDILAVLSREFYSTGNDSVQ